MAKSKNKGRIRFSQNIRLSAIRARSNVGQYGRYPMLNNAGVIIRVKVKPKEE